MRHPLDSLKTAAVIFISGFFLVGCAPMQQPSVTTPLPHAEEPLQAVKKKPLFIIEKAVSTGFDSVTQSTRFIDTIIVHTARAEPPNEYEVDALLAVFAHYRVASHYVIDRNGTVFRLVDEKNIAHHAGKSRMSDGREGVNAFSVGIELINGEEDRPTVPQYDSLALLVTDICGRYKIEHILGHKDIAPSRKSDPWNFDFELLTKLLQKEQKLAHKE